MARKASDSSDADESRRETLTAERVVAVAADMADRDGLDAVTLTRVAEELGVQQPALYRHVGGADDLVRRLGLLGRTILADRLTEAAIGRSGPDAIKAVGAAWREMARAHPGLYAATDRCPCVGDPELEQAALRVVNVLQQSLVSFDLDPDQRVHAARSLRSAFHGFAHLELGDGHPNPVDVDESFDHLVGLLTNGIDLLSRTGSIAH